MKMKNSRMKIELGKVYQFIPNLIFYIFDKRFLRRYKIHKL